MAGTLAGAAGALGHGARCAGASGPHRLQQAGLRQGEPHDRGPGHQDRLDWFRDARFGLFVHWGPYSVAGVEASWPIMVPELAQLIGPDQKISEADYVALARRFDPRDFDPREWIRFARDAGMRYLVITAKHHDGYCLFDAPGTDYKITAGPYGRDLLAELAEVCGEQGFPLGFYYSPPDMHHPGYRDTARPTAENWTGEPERPQWIEYLDAMEAQLRKLLTDYGEVAVIWFDGLFEHDKYDPQRFHRLVHELSPATLVNDRLGADLGDYVTPEQAVPDGIPVRRTTPAPELTARAFRQFVDMLTSGLSAEQADALFSAAQRARFPIETLPSAERFQPWETCMTLGKSWAYDPLERELKSAEDVIRALVDVASRGGNLLLNVGPTPEGRFPDSARRRLREVGDWLDRHGEAIYGTTFGPIQGEAGIRSTARQDRVYVHLVELPQESLQLPRLRSAPPRARLLPDGPEFVIRTDEASSVVEGLRLPEDDPMPVLEIRMGGDPKA